MSVLDLVSVHYVHVWNWQKVKFNEKKLEKKERRGGRRRRRKEGRKRRRKEGMGNQARL